MNAKHLWALEEFVEQSKAWILTANPRLSDIRSRAETELGFKCPDGPIRDCMTRHEIPVRRSKEEAEKYKANVEPSCPLVSLRGEPKKFRSYEEYISWKEWQDFEEYDYKKMFTPGGSNPSETMIMSK